MSKNSNLHSAKKEKNDEFYTQINDIANELKHYKDHFKDKIVLCNCDDPTWSNFWRYFHLNFEFLGLKKLISTHYDMKRPTYKLVYEGGDDNNIEKGIKTELDGNGDFRNTECIDLLKEADIVVTNPPFSLFREYVAQLIKYDKKFIIIGNKNAITYKEFFPYIKNDKVWLGNTSPDEFNTPDGLTKKVKGLCRWLTNLDIQKHHEKLILWRKYYNEDGTISEDAKKLFLKYDNYDAINVDKVADIPLDYEGVMGVLITFLDKYNPEQFEIVSFRKGEDGKDLVFTREREFNLIFVSLYDIDSGDDKKLRRENKWKDYLCKNNNTKAKIEPIDYFYPRRINFSGNDRTHLGGINGKYTYSRLFIQHK